MFGKKENKPYQATPETEKEQSLYTLKLTALGNGQSLAEINANYDHPLAKSGKVEAEDHFSTFIIPALKELAKRYKVKSFIPVLSSHDYFGNHATHSMAVLLED